MTGLYTSWVVFWDRVTELIYDCRFDERLKPKDDESTCLTYTGLLEELEYQKIETRLIDEKFASVMGECDLDMMVTPSKLSVIRKTDVLARDRATLLLSWSEKAARR
jgi:hypothetical protein